MSASTKLSPMAIYYVRRLVQSRKDLLEQMLQDPVLVEAALSEPEALLDRLSLPDLERLQRVNNLEILARAYQNLSKEGRHPTELKEIERQILTTLGFQNLEASALSNLLKDAPKSAAPALSAREALEVLQGILTSSSSYLGPKIASEYWISSRPPKEWLDSFILNTNHKLLWSGSHDERVSGQKLEDLQVWVKTYIRKCSHIIHGFQDMIDTERLKSLSISSQDF
jgi:hypothetical protein